MWPTFSSELAWLRTSIALILLIFSKYQFITLITPIMFPAFNIIEILQFYCSFLLIALIFSSSYFSCLINLQDKFIDLRTFFFTNIYIQCYNFICKDCFSCILQLLMLCFHLVQIIIIFYVSIVQHIYFNQFNKWLMAECQRIVVFISSTLVKIIFNFSWDIIWYLFHLLNWLKYWSNVFNFKISGSIFYLSVINFSFNFWYSLGLCVIYIF